MYIVYLHIYLYTHTFHEGEILMQVFVLKQRMEKRLEEDIRSVDLLQWMHESFSIVV